MQVVTGNTSLKLCTLNNIILLSNLLFSEQHNVCKACYGVIENYLKGNSRKNENYLARFMEFFKTQIGMGLNAEKVMIEMVEDNR